MIDEQLLRRRLQVAVADVRPPSRLDEIVGGAPKRPPRRAQQVLAVAAVVLVLAAIAAIVATTADRDEAVTTDEPTTTTTTDAGPQRETLGASVSVPADLLPAGFVLVSEVEGTAEIADDTVTYTVATFGRSAADVEAGGPALRVAVLPQRLWVNDLELAVEALGADPPALGDTLRIDAPWTPAGTDELLGSDGEWARIGRATAPDVLLLVDGRGVDDPTLEAIVAQATPST